MGLEIGGAALRPTLYRAAMIGARQAVLDLSSSQVFINLRLS